MHGSDYVYVWADGVYFNIRLADDDTKKQCILVLMGATADGREEFIAVSDVYRESKDSWLEVIRDLKRRRMTAIPKLAIGDGPSASGPPSGKSGGASPSSDAEYTRRATT